MLPATIPAMLIAPAVYALAGDSPGEASFVRVPAITKTLQGQFWLGLVPLIPALVVAVLSVMRWPPLPSPFASVLQDG